MSRRKDKVNKFFNMLEKDSLGFLLGLACEWEYYNKPSAKSYYAYWKVMCILYGILTSDRMYNYKENNTRWHQIIKAVV